MSHLGPNEVTKSNQGRSVGTQRCTLPVHAYHQTSLLAYGCRLSVGQPSFLSPSRSSWSWPISPYRAFLSASPSRGFLLYQGTNTCGSGSSAPLLAPMAAPYRVHVETPAEPAYGPLPRRWRPQLRGLLLFPPHHRPSLAL